MDDDLQPDRSGVPVQAPATTGAASLDDTAGMLNRELSWLQFNERVLEIAADPSVPLLERARFLAIFSRNLDEFFQIRVAGLTTQLDAGLNRQGADGLGALEQLQAIAAAVTPLVDRHAALFSDVIAPQLTDQGIVITDTSSLDHEDQQHLSTWFDEHLLPILTPLAVDPAHPFPYISARSLNLAVLLAADKAVGPRFVRIKVPPVVDRFVPIAGSQRYVAVERVIAANLSRVLNGEQVIAHYAFRLLRNADFTVEEDADDLLEAIQAELLRRRFGRVVRLEVEHDMPPEMLALLLSELRLHESLVARIRGPLDLSGLDAFSQLARPDLHYAPVVTRPPIIDRDEPADLFARIRRSDLLVHHPYDSFDSSVLALLRQAAADPDVVAIKQTLYRTSGPDSPVIQALLDAATAGKQVVALIELKARFDEENNIAWARRLEEAGIHVAYGVVGLKTHTKIALIVRREDGGLRRYAHIGTGNYNEKTARSYEDLGLFTTDEDIGADVTDLFNALTGHAQLGRPRSLIVAPSGLREFFLDAIAEEARHSDGHIVAKVNSLVDSEIIEALYEASRRGTKIELIVRGVCCLRPGVEELSPTITVRSVVGRLLEHSRIFRFGSPQRSPRYYIGSADLMDRNLDRRIEVIAPIKDPRLQRQLDETLRILMADDTNAWQLGADGRWRKVATSRGVNAHLALQSLRTEASDRSERDDRGVAARRRR